jgi:hypothetical protein
MTPNLSALLYLTAQTILLKLLITPEVKVKLQAPKVAV